MILSDRRTMSVAFDEWRLWHLVAECNTARPHQGIANKPIGTIAFPEGATGPPWSLAFSYLRRNGLFADTPQHSNLVENAIRPTRSSRTAAVWRSTPSSTCATC